MFKPLELFIGLRYTRAKRRNHFISFIALTSMLGIALGVMALITVLSVMNGFQKELRDRILGVVAHATVSGAGGGVLHDWQPLAQRLDRVPGQFGSVLGKELALRLGVGRGDMITLIAPQATVTPAGILPRLKRFTIVGIFEIGMYEYDSALALLDLDDAAN